MSTREIRHRGNSLASGKRLTAAERRSQLLRIAKGLFAECGFVSTTTKAIAESAGVAEIAASNAPPPADSGIGYHSCNSFPRQGA